MLHVLEAEPSGADLGVMCQRNPLHTFMFDGLGKLLNANKAAFEASESDPPGAVAKPRHVFASQGKARALCIASMLVAIYFRKL